MPAADGALRRTVLPLLLAYPLLALAGALTHRPIFGLAALLLLITLWMLPRLLGGMLSAWLVWLLAVALVLGLSSLGLSDLLLASVPLLINAALAWWFGRTLRRGCEPRVARFIRVLEGSERLALPEVARYARQVTAFWAILLALQALLLAALLLVTAPHGPFASPGALPRWIPAYQHVGGYLVIALAFAAEYAYRRWHLRHLEHDGLHVQALQMMQRWPQLLHEPERPGT
jgi:uncharacterized membrane protein